MSYIESRNSDPTKLSPREIEAMHTPEPEPDPEDSPLAHYLEDHGFPPLTQSQKREKVGDIKGATVVLVNGKTETNKEAEAVVTLYRRGNTIGSKADKFPMDGRLSVGLDGEVETEVSLHVLKNQLPHIEEKGVQLLYLMGDAAEYRLGILKEGMYRIHDLTSEAEGITSTVIKTKQNAVNPIQRPVQFPTASAAYNAAAGK